MTGHLSSSDNTSAIPLRKTRVLDVTIDRVKKYTIGALLACLAGFLLATVIQLLVIFWSWDLEDSFGNSQVRTALCGSTDSDKFTEEARFASIVRSGVARTYELLLWALFGLTCLSCLGLVCSATTLLLLHVRQSNANAQETSGQDVLGQLPGTTKYLFATFALLVALAIITLMVLIQKEIHQHAVPPPCVPAGSNHGASGEAPSGRASAVVSFRGCAESVTGRIPGMFG